MNGHFLPPESFVVEPWWLNFFTNMALLQVPVALGAAHQAGAMVLFGLPLWTVHAHRRA